MSSKPTPPKPIQPSPPPKAPPAPEPSDHVHFFRGDAPCACGLTIRDVQAKGIAPAEVKHATVRPAAPVDPNHAHVFRAMNEPCTLCGISFEDAQSEARPAEEDAAANDKARVAELELELEQAHKRLELLEYLHEEKTAEIADGPLPSEVRMGIRQIAMHGTTLVDPELLDALISELQLAAAKLRQLQQARKLRELEQR